MPKQIEVRPGQVVEFPDDAPDSAIVDYLQKNFPATGEDVANELQKNPEIDKQLSDEDFAKYKKYMEDKHSSLIAKIPEAFGAMLSTIWEGNKAIVQDPLKAIPSAIEGGVQNARNYYGMVAQSDDPSSWAFGVKRFWSGNDSVADQKKQWLEARDFVKKSGRLARGEEGLVIDPKYTNPAQVAAAQIIVDPMLLVPMAGEALKGTALGARIAEAAASAAKATGVARALNAVDVVTAKAGELAATAGRGVVKPAIALGDKAVELTGRALETVAPGISLSEGKAIAAGAGGVGALLNPVAAKFAAVYGGAKVADAALELTQAANKLNAGLPSRLGTLARLAEDASLSPLARKMATAGAAIEPALDAAGAAAKGAVHGAAIGGAIGAYGHGAEGAGEGIGSGMVIGSVGALAGRAFARASGKLKAAESQGDVVRFAASRPDGMLAASLLGKFKPDVVAGITDVASAMEAQGTKVHFVNEATLPSFIDDKWFPTKQEALDYAVANGIDATKVTTPSYKGVSVGGKDVFLNVDRMTTDTAIHEAQHALERQLAAKGLADSLMTASDKVLSDADWINFADGYLKSMKEGRLALDPKFVEARNVIETGKGDVAAAKRLIVDEFASHYAGEWLSEKPKDYLLDGQRSLFRKVFTSAVEQWKGRNAVDAQMNGWDFASRGVQGGFRNEKGGRMRISALDNILEHTFKNIERPEARPVDVRGMPLDQAAKILQVEGADSLLKTDASGKVIGIKTGKEVSAETDAMAKDIQQRLAALPADQRSTATSLDPKGNILIKGEKLSPHEIDAISQSPYLSPSAREYLKLIGNSLSDPNGRQIFRGRYWKVYGETRGGQKVAGVYPVSERLLMPYQVEVNSKGGVFARFLDVSRVQDRLTKAMKLPEYKGLYPDFNSAWRDLTEKLLPNYDKPDAIPGAQALGGGEAGNAKRNLFYEALGTVPRTVENPTVMANAPRSGYYPSRRGGHTFESMRIDRIAALEPTNSRAPFSESRAYENTLKNFQPAETVESAAIMDGEGNIWKGVNHAEAWEWAQMHHDAKGTAINMPEGGDGFVTNTGRFISREEAYNLAKDAKQLSKKDAQNPEFHDNWSGTKQLEAETFDQLRRFQPADPEVENRFLDLQNQSGVRFAPLDRQPENQPIKVPRLSEQQQKNIDELKSYYEAVTPQRIDKLKSDAIESFERRLINSGIPVKDAISIARDSYRTVYRLSSGARQVISGLGESDLSRLAGTGKPIIPTREHLNPNWLTSAFESFANDSDLAVMKAQQVAAQLNKQQAAAVARGESVDKGRASGVRQSTLDQGRNFVLGEMAADTKAFGSNLRQDSDAPPRVYASVVEGQKFGAQGNYKVFFEWNKNTTPIVATSHHHYGVANGITDIHASANVGDKNSRSFGNPQAESYDTLPSGRRVLNTHLLVGNEGIDAARAHQLIVSISKSAVEDIQSAYKEGGIDAAKKRVNSTLMQQLVGQSPKGKTKWYTSREGVKPKVAVQRNRTEAYILNPDLNNVKQVTIVENDPKAADLLKRNVKAAFENNGYKTPSIKLVTAESGDSGFAGRKAITDQYFNATGNIAYQPAEDMGNAKLRSHIERQIRNGELETVDAAIKRVRENGWQHITDHALKYAQQAREELLAGNVSPRTVAKGYSITLASIGANSIGVDKVAKAARKLGLEFNADKMFFDGTKTEEGVEKIRPEEAFAWWLGTKRGQEALNDIEKGKFNAKAWQQGIDFRNAYGRNDLQKKTVISGEAPAPGAYTVNIDGNPVQVKAKTSTKTGITRWSHTINGDPPDSVVVPQGLTRGKPIFKPQSHGKLKNELNEYNLRNILKLTADINATKGDPEKLASVLLRIKGIAAAKKGFLGHLLGYSNWVTSDAVEINAINAGVADPKLEQSKVTPKQQKNIDVWNKAVKSDLLNQFVNDAITKQVMGVFDNIKADTGWDDEFAGHLSHHAMWDAYKGTQTTHEGMYYAMRNYQPADAFTVEDVGGGRSYTNADGYRILRGASGKFRLYAPTGALISIHDSLNKATDKWQQVASSRQQIPSADTSIPQVPAAFKKIKWKKGQTNTSIGAGKYDLGEDYLRSRGVTSYPYDPFNRSEDVNRSTVDTIKKNPTDVATVPNVLNVIKEPEIRDNVILQAAKSIKPDGVAYFFTYEGDKSGVGRITKEKDGVAKSWQENRPTASYIPEIQKHFAIVERRGGLIIAKDPITDGKKANWQLNAEGTKSIRFSPFIEKWGAEKWGAEKGKAFAEWFGDSKVVNDKGEPMVVYHGTAADFSRFKMPKRGSATTNATIKDWGSFFSHDPKYAGEFAYFAGVTGNGNANIVPAYLSLQNPKEVDYKTWRDFINYGFDPNNPRKYEKEYQARSAANAFKKQAIKDGHDGFIIRNEKGEPFEIVAFHPTQIKSIWNKGTWSNTDPIISYQPWRSEPLGDGTVMHSPSGARIVQISPQHQYRLYSPAGALMGVYATAALAQRRAESQH